MKAISILQICVSLYVIIYCGAMAVRCLTNGYGLFCAVFFGIMSLLGCLLAKSAVREFRDLTSGK